MPTGVELRQILFEPPPAVEADKDGFEPVEDCHSGIGTDQQLRMREFPVAVARFAERPRYPSAGIDDDDPLLLAVEERDASVIEDYARSPADRAGEVEARLGRGDERCDRNRLALRGLRCRKRTIAATESRQTHDESASV